MPLYCYKCPVCNRPETMLRPMRESSAEGPMCQQCSETSMVRDISAEHVNSTDQEYDRPVLSDSLGVHPSQIKDAQRRFQHHEFAPDGRMVIRSHNQYKKIRKELGFHDKAGYC